MMRGTRSRYCGAMRVSHRSGGSLAWLSVETMKYFFGSSARAVRCHPAWPGVSRRHRLGALMAASLMRSSVVMTVPRQRSCNPPLHQCIRRCRVIVWLEHRLDRRADRHLLVRIAKQVAEHAHVAGLGQFDEHG